MPSSNNPSPRSGTDTSESLRAEGNSLYRDGKLLQAVEKYLGAIALDERDPAPRRTLSSARFELGDYEGCLTAINQAVPLELDANKRQALRVRQVKCYFHLKRFSEAVELGQKLVDEIQADPGELQTIIDMAKLHEKIQPSKKAIRKRLLETLDIPIYRPKMHKGIDEYYPRGHDETEAAFRYPKLVKRAEKLSRLDLCLFYGGVGDARHFYQQLHHIYAYKEIRREAKKNHRSNTSPIPDKFFFTVQDLKPHMMARNVIVFKLLYELARLKDRMRGHGRRAVEREATNVLATVWYVFACDIMPAYIHSRINKLMQTMCDREEDNFGITWLRVDPETARRIRDVFKSWLSKEMSEMYDVHHAQTQLVWHKFPETFNRGFFKKMTNVRKEWEQFEETAVVYPPISILREEDKDFAALLRSSKNKNRSQRRKTIAEYARRNWKTNVTLLQEHEWYKKWGHTWNDTCDQLETIERFMSGATDYALQPILYSGNEPSLIEICMPFFQSCAEVLMESDISVECRIGEVNQMLDEIRFGKGADQKRELPRLYDSIFFSNIPDYTGGHLIITLHALPLLKPSGFVNYNVLVNPVCFTEGVSRTLAEYVCLPSIASSRAMLGLARISRPTPNPILLKPEWMYLMDPIRWGRAKTISVAHVPTKNTFTRWLTQMFLKLCLPVPRQVHDPTCRIHQPLTLATWIRLCSYLVADMSFAAHWVSGLIDSILTGSINTTARAPTTAALSLKEVTNLDSNSVQTVYTDAFVPELTALLVRFRGTLPFTLLTKLPSLDQINRYSIRFEIFDESVGPTAKVLGLAFVSQYLDHDELSQLHPGLSGKSPKLAAQLRSKVCLVGSFEWATKQQDSNTGSENKDHNDSGSENTGSSNTAVLFWLQTSVVEHMKQKRWKAVIIRTDMWTPVSHEKTMTDIEIG